MEIENGTVFTGNRQQSSPTAPGQIARFAVGFRLNVVPPKIAPFNGLTLTTGFGTPGTLAMLTVVEVNGAPAFLPVRFNVLDGCGDWTEYYWVNPGLSGTSLKLRSFGQDLDGKFRATPIATLDFL